MGENLDLRRVELSDRVHLLACEAANNVRSLCNSQNAEYVNYRDQLLARTLKSDKFLVLDRYIDREIEGFRDLCSQSPGRVLVVDEVDILLAYLRCRPGPQLDIFWDRLRTARHFNALLWIVLPATCIPSRWPQTRIRLAQLPNTGTATWIS